MKRNTRRERWATQAEDACFAVLFGISLLAVTVAVCESKAWAFGASPRIGASDIAANVNSQRSVEQPSFRP